MYAAQKAVLLYVRSTPMVTGADLDVEALAGLLELEPQPAIPAMRAAAARPAAADAPKRLRSTIGPPVSTSSGSTAVLAPRPRCVRVVRAWKIDPMYRRCQRLPGAGSRPSPK